MSVASTWSKAGPGTWIGVCIVGALNLAALLFGLGMLALAISELNYQGGGERWGRLGVFIYGGIGLIVEVVLLFPITLLFYFATSKTLPLWFRTSLALVLLAGIAAAAAAFGCVFAD